MDNNTYLNDIQFEERYLRVLDTLYIDMLYKGQIAGHEELEQTVDRYQTVNDITHYAPPANSNQEIYDAKAGLFSNNFNDMSYATKKDTGLAKVISMNAYVNSNYNQVNTFARARKDFQSNVGIMFNTLQLPVQPQASNNNVPSAAEVESSIKANTLISTLYGDNVTEKDETPVIDMTPVQPEKQTAKILNFPWREMKSNKLII